MRRLLVAAATAAAVLGCAAFTAGPAPAMAALTLSKSTAKVGERLTVTGSGFPAGARLQVEVCGIGGSSNSCAIGAAVLATTDAFGGFHQNLLVTEPPTPCPCTVHAAPYGGATADPVDTAIAIPGLRFLPEAAQQAAGNLKLLDATADDDSPFLTRIGADGSARVTLTFGNLGGGPAGDPGVALTLARGGEQVGRYPVAWTGGPLPVGQRRRLVYEVPLPGGWFRDYEIGVELGTDGGAVKSLTARTLPASVRPWGELVAPAALAVGLLCLLAGRRRHYRAVAALPVREGAVPGRRSGAAVPGPFSAVEAATLGIVVAPDPGGATAEAPETGPATALATLETSETVGNESP
ncbi:hypothetical protein GCM10009839_15880 [Catenulispora yoronensis]|uniref:IPT/TIG domain-containing protein n=1 Tax=Catenulispora yoronensis TaxID=450799 RepID=A0ABP5F8B6_9ACTN